MHRERQRTDRIKLVNKMRKTNGSSELDPTGTIRRSKWSQAFQIIKIQTLRRRQVKLHLRVLEINKGPEAKQTYVTQN